jgi:selenocysteine-specific elongation factor
VALNLSGLEKQALKRGDVIVKPGQDQAVSVLYIDLRLLPQIQWSLKKPVSLQVMLGSAEVLGTAVLLDRKELLPGENGLVELRLKEPLVPRLGDRVILRLPGPQLTIGGGPILDWSASAKTPDRDFLIQILQNRKNLQLPDLIVTELEKHGFIKPSDLLKSSHFSLAEIQDEVKKLLAAERIQRQGEYICHSLTVNRLKEGVLKQLQEFHQEFPYKPGLKVQELSSQLKSEPEVLQMIVDILEREKLIAEKQGYLALRSHQPRLTGALQKKHESLLRILETSSFSPPSRDELLKRDPNYDLVVTYLIQNGELLELRDGLLFRTSDFKTVATKVEELIQQKGKVSVSDVREALATSRKYAVPILEKLDQLGITKRKGDFRVLNER